MVKLKAEFEQMIQELSHKENSEIYKLSILTYEDPIIIAGIDGGNFYRQLYIDLGTEPWEEDQIKSLPKWRGLTIDLEYHEKLFLLEDHYFLVVKQGDGHSSDIFESVLQNMLDHLILDTTESMFSTIVKVLDRWRFFFQRGGFRKLSDEQLRGLFGELYFINQWLDKFPGQPPLIIEQWEGPTQGRIDFKGSKFGLEIKTVIDKLAKTIKISNENQLMLTEAVSSIYLYVCYLEQSRTHGMSLQDIVSQVHEKLTARSERIALMFSELLLENGYREDEYTDKLYFVEKVEVYEADEHFPRLLKDDLPRGISHVSYNIDLTHCSHFQRDEEEFYEKF
ncbi:PD-(D/E)XK motif protein [Bacillus dakarensis]|uniref:PD-(D/E)XK motif protein n=1 Tax=Robertmurraya dakarensis TaxID=1926278 RepID=UPI0009815FC1|nr:PD-(D/E)XK motif protein [Bacillus dakarensis]